MEFKEFSLPYLRDIARRVKDKIKESGLDNVPMVSRVYLLCLSTVFSFLLRFFFNQLLFEAL